MRVLVSGPQAVDIRDGFVLVPEPDERRFEVVSVLVLVIAQIVCELVRLELEAPRDGVHDERGDGVERAEQAHGDHQADDERPLAREGESAVL